jgi:hypothetical protein
MQPFNEREGGEVRVFGGLRACWVKRDFEILILCNDISTNKSAKTGLFNHVTEGKGVIAASRLEFENWLFNN